MGAGREVLFLFALMCLMSLEVEDSLCEMPRIPGLEMVANKLVILLSSLANVCDSTMNLSSSKLLAFGAKEDGQFLF